MLTPQVCDLQGVQRSSDYKLTDPVVHSLDRLFGKTDLGVVGMESVLANHNCNFICQQLGLQNPLRNVYIPGRIPAGIQLNRLVSNYALMVTNKKTESHVPYNHK